jgi:DNA ligase (NAD+)
LDVAALSVVERISDSVAAKLLALLKSKNQQTLESLLGALSIPLCATSTIQMVTDAGFDTWEKIQAASLIQLRSIPGLGPVKAEALHGWLHGIGPSLVQDLLAMGVCVQAKVQGNLTGKTFCFTGTMQHKRSDLEALVAKNGGVVKPSVAKGLTYLVIADPNSTSSKADAARKYGTKCISEDAFLAMVRP